MSNQPFLELTKEENLQYMDIDERLIPAFTEAMIRIQNFFNLRELNDVLNYEELFSKFLLDGNHKRSVCFYVETEEDMDHRHSINDYNLGTYCYYNCIIEIGYDTLDDYNELVNTLIHEFIHFIVSHRLEAKKIAKFSRFLDEAFTETLTALIIGVDTGAYITHVRLLDLYLKLGNETEIIRRFLQGKQHPEDGDINWEKFVYHAEEFHNDQNKTDCPGKDSNNEYYIKAQTHLLKYLLRKINIKTYPEFFKFFSVLATAPAKKDPFLPQAYELIKNSYIESNGFALLDKEIFLLFKELLIALAKINASNKTDFEIETSDEFKTLVDTKRIFEDILEPNYKLIIDLAGSEEDFNNIEMFSYSNNPANNIFLSNFQNTIKLLGDYNYIGEVKNLNVELTNKNSDVIQIKSGYKFHKPGTNAFYIIEYLNNNISIYLLQKNNKAVKLTREKIIDYNDHAILNSIFSKLSQKVEPIKITYTELIKKKEHLEVHVDQEYKRKKFRHSLLIKQIQMFNAKTSVDYTLSFNEQIALNNLIKEEKATRLEIEEYLASSNRRKR